MIIIKDKKDMAKLYHHFDGYPAGVGAFLMEHVYPLLQHSNSETVESLAKFLAKEDSGYVPTTGFHSDIEYLYIIDITRKQIKCLSGHYQRRQDGSVSPIFHTNQEVDLMNFLPIKGRMCYA